MISLPIVGDYTSNKIPVPINRDNIFVISVLNKGTKLFEENGFQCSIPPNKESSYHIRMSQIGDCARKQWLYLNEPDKMEAEEIEHSYKVEAIHATNLGNILEDYTITLLRLGGLTVSDEQKELKDLNGLISGHIDGTLVINKKFLLELKALNVNSASKIVKNGVEKGNIVYYSQMQYYMHCLGLESAYFIAFIKDSGQFYVELVESNPVYQKLLRQRAIVIGNTHRVEDIPEKHVVRECTFCPAKNICAELEGGEKEFIKKFKEYHNI